MPSTNAMLLQYITEGKHNIINTTNDSMSVAGHSTVLLDSLSRPLLLIYSAVCQNLLAHDL